MTPRNLEIFVAVAELGSMSAAARELVITQSSVSQVILDIEKEYGIMIFERLNRGLKLTPTGQELLKYAKSILLLNKELDIVLNHESKITRMRLGATATVGATVMEQIVKDLQGENANMKCEVFVANTQKIEEMIQNNDLDIGLVEGSVKNPDLIQEVVIHDKMVLICNPSHYLSKKTSVTIEELQNEHWIMREQGSGTRAQIMRELKAHNIEPDIRWCCNGIEAIKSAVKSNLGISILSSRLIASEVKNGELCRCYISNANMDRSFKLIYHKDKFMTKSIKNFVNLCYKHGNEEEK